MVRLKSRYVLFEIIYPPESIAEAELDRMDDVMMGFHKSTRNYHEINSKTILQEIRRVVQYNFGDLGSGQLTSLLHLKYFSNATSTGILRCHREDLNILLTTLALVNKIGDYEGIILNPVKVSGTIKKLEQYAIRRNHNFINALKRFELNKMKISEMNMESSTFENEIRDIPMDSEDN